MSDLNRIERLWEGFRVAVVHEDAPAVQVSEMRLAFFGGAHALYSEIMKMLDPGSEATEGDMRKMELIAAELKRHADQVRMGTR